MKYLGVEIGGTKLQLAVGSGDGGPLDVIERIDVRPEEGAEGILRQVSDVAPRLLEKYDIQRMGIGFGGPVDAAAGLTIRSHQVNGWEQFPLTRWCREQLAVAAALGNDSDLAGLGEATFGAGKDKDVVFYSNVGSGIGGALVIRGQLYTGGGGIASEIGHLRPSVNAQAARDTVESESCGWAIAAATRQRIVALDDAARSIDAQDILNRCGGDLQQLTARAVADALAEGNSIAENVFESAIRTYGWALAQVVTLLAPNVLVIGGGVPKAGESLFFEPLRREVARYVFPPLSNAYEIVPAALGEEVVPYGALALAAASR